MNIGVHSPAGATKNGKCFLSVRGSKMRGIYPAREVYVASQLLASANLAFSVEHFWMEYHPMMVRDTTQGAGLVSF